MGQARWCRCCRGFSLGVDPGRALWVHGSRGFTGRMGLRSEVGDKVREVITAEFGIKF